MVTASAAANPLANFSLIFGGVFAGIGTLFVVIGLGVILFRRRARRKGVPTTATIVGFRPMQRTIGVGGGFGVGDAPPEMAGSAGMTGPGFSDTLYPVVDFQTADGQRIRTTARNGSNPARGRVGKPITVRYDTAHPDRVWADTGGRVLIGFIEVTFIGLGLLALSVGLAVLRTA
jgi:hypothetical protein